MILENGLTLDALAEVGDRLAMRLDRPIVFHNPAGGEARYLVALAADPVPLPGLGARSLP